jgi:lysophospholipase
MSEQQNSFRLSGPGSSQARDPVMSEYLHCYELPQPPAVRYGFRRFESRQPTSRVGLFGQAWVPAHAAGTVLLLHGYAEHGGNYSRLVKDLLEAKFAVAMLDLRGHGLSEGPRGHAETPYSYAEDAEAFLEDLFPHLLPHRPLYLWGHSLGALIGLQLLLRDRLPVRPAAAVFSSALLGFAEFGGSKRHLTRLAPAISALFPALPLAHGIPAEALSHDEEYLARRLEDPLIGRVSTPRWFLSTRDAMAEVHANAANFENLSPTLFLLAGEEKVTSLSDARRFAIQAYPSMRHKVIEFPGYYHELEKEKGIRARVVSESLAWMRNHEQRK